MAAEFAVYDLDQVSLSFCGLPIEGGYGDGSAIKVTQLEPDFVNKVGADGTVTRSKTGKRLTKVEVTLMQTAKGNAIFSALNNVDRLASNGAAVGPFLLRDMQGLSIIAAEHSWLEGPPADAEYNTEASNRVWVIFLADPERFDGGN
jgi:hypothetical protein